MANGRALEDDEPAGSELARNDAGNPDKPIGPPNPPFPAPTDRADDDLSADMGGDGLS